MSLELTDIVVRRSGRAILDGVNLCCKSGQFTAICGPNGAGKTTAFSVMTGVLRPTGGRTRLHGRPLDTYARSELARIRAALSQHSELGFPFQVHEVVRMGRAGLASSIRANDDRVCHEVMTTMNLTALADRNYLSLSGGERQRVNIARVLAQVWDATNDTASAPLLLLDEPAAALDLKNQELLFRVLKACTGWGWGIVAVLHDLHQIIAHADHVVLLQSGRIFASGAPRSVLTPQTIQQGFGLSEPYHQLQD